jgi:hypothetical protein
VWEKLVPREYASSQKQPPVLAQFSIHWCPLFKNENWFHNFNSANLEVQKTAWTPALCEGTTTSNRASTANCWCPKEAYRRKLGRLVCNKCTLRCFHSNIDCSIVRNISEPLLVSNESQGPCIDFDTTHADVSLKSQDSVAVFYTRCIFPSVLRMLPWTHWLWLHCPTFSLFLSKALATLYEYLPRRDSLATTQLSYDPDSQDWFVEGRTMWRDQRRNSIVASRNLDIMTTRCDCFVHLVIWSPRPTSQNGRDLDGGARRSTFRSFAARIAIISRRVFSSSCTTTSSPTSSPDSPVNATVAKYELNPMMW